MATIQYTAQKRLISGHSASTSYIMEFGLAQSDFKGKIYSSSHESLSGKREVVKQSREDDEWVITTTKILKADEPQWQEFFYSVIDGTPFSVDLYGTIAVPDNVQSMVMISKDYTLKRNRTSDFFSLTFTVRLVA